MKKHLLLFIVFILFTGKNYADVEIVVSQGQKITLSIGDLGATTEDEKKVALEIKEILNNDLSFMRQFTVKDGKTLSPSNIPDFQYWVDLGTEMLVTGKIEIKDNNLTFTGKLFKTKEKEQIFAQTYRGNKDLLRRLTHEFSDDLYYRLTGLKGIARARIAFANNANGNKEICLIDYDGYNLWKLTSDNSVSLLPRWSRDNKYLIYTSYYQGNPDLYRINLGSGKREDFSYYQGMNIGGSFSPNDEYFVATLSRDGNSEIYLLSLKGEIVRRLTWSRAVDVSPSFSPNGKEIVFVSDRSGLPQLYIMDSEGLNLRRLTYNGYCDSPQWSPQGDKIVYAFRDGSYFQINTISPDGSNQQQLTNEGTNENPYWSPDGQWIVYASKRSKRYELYIMKSDGSNKKRVTELKGDSVTPCWSN